jgi:hypothetical protein
LTSIPIKGKGEDFKRNLEIMMNLSIKQLKELCEYIRMNSLTEAYKIKAIMLIDFLIGLRQRDESLYYQ